MCAFICEYLLRYCFFLIPQSADPEAGNIYEDADKSRFDIDVSKALGQESIDQMTYPNRTNAAQASNN